MKYQNNSGKTESVSITSILLPNRLVVTNSVLFFRFSSSKSGRIYLEGEISMLVCRQYDADATLGLDPLDSNSHLTSVIVSPHNPKYSPRK